jgi:hypothetical protein
LCRKLADELNQVKPLLDTIGANLIAVGPGSVSFANKFHNDTSFTGMFSFKSGHHKKKTKKKKQKKKKKKKKQITALWRPFADAKFANIFPFLLQAKHIRTVNISYTKISVASVDGAALCSTQRPSSP